MEFEPFSTEHKHIIIVYLAIGLCNLNFYAWNNNVFIYPQRIVHAPNSKVKIYEFEWIFLHEPTLFESFLKETVQMSWASSMMLVWVAQFHDRVLQKAKNRLKLTFARVHEFQRFINDYEDSFHKIPLLPKHFEHIPHIQKLKNW